MKIKIITLEDEYLGNFGSDIYFIAHKKILDEIKKYKCPFRLAKYLMELKKNNFISESSLNNNIEYIHDISDSKFDVLENLNKINNINIKNYIEKTNYLDKYGVKIDE